MLFEQVYVLFIYILIGKLAMVVTIRRLDYKKNTSLSGHRDVFYYN